METEMTNREKYDLLNMEYRRVSRRGIRGLGPINSSVKAKMEHELALKRRNDQYYKTFGRPVA